MKLSRELNAIATIATRDLVRFLNDRARFLASFIFPLVFVGILGGTSQASLGKAVGFDFLLFTFTGVLAQTLFQSTASGIISLVQDREQNFSQEMFIAPVTRFSILFGKILGESLVSLAQFIGICVMGFFLQINFGISDIIRIIPAAILVCIFGGAFGLLVLSNLKDQRMATQIFPFIMFPQFFLAGVFTPITNLPPYLFLLSRIAPMTYEVDFVRSIYYWGSPEYSKVVLYNPITNLVIMAVLFLIFTSIGTWVFVRNERNR